jgi:hypothetical protein
MTDGIQKRLAKAEAKTRPAVALTLKPAPWAVEIVSMRSPLLDWILRGLPRAEEQDILPADVATVLERTKAQILEEAGELTRRYKTSEAYSRAIKDIDPKKKAKIGAWVEKEIEKR